MINRNGKIGRVLAVSSLTGLLCAGCASNRAHSANQGNTRVTQQDTAMPYGGTATNQNNSGMGGSGWPAYGPDTVRTDTMPHTGGYPGTGGTGTGGSMGLPDSGYDTSGVYRGPTGPMSDTGVGGAGGIPPGPDTMWRDTLNPTDTSRLPRARSHSTQPGNW